MTVRLNTSLRKSLRSARLLAEIVLRVHVVGRLLTGRSGALRHGRLVTSLLLLLMLRRVLDSQGRRGMRLVRRVGEGHLLRKAASAGGAVSAIGAAEVLLLLLTLLILLLLKVLLLLLVLILVLRRCR